MAQQEACTHHEGDSANKKWTQVEGKKYFTLKETEIKTKMDPYLRWSMFHTNPQQYRVQDSQDLAILSRRWKLTVRLQFTKRLTTYWERNLGNYQTTTNTIQHNDKSNYRIIFSFFWVRLPPFFTCFFINWPYCRDDHLPKLMQQVMLQGYFAPKIHHFYNDEKRKGDAHQKRTFSLTVNNRHHEWEKHVCT